MIQWWPTLYLVAGLVNQLILARMFYRFYKEEGHIKLSGCVFLSAFGWILGYMFTALCALAWFSERYE